MDNMVRTRPVQMLPGLDEGSGLVLISVLASLFQVSSKALFVVRGFTPHRWASALTTNEHTDSGQRFNRFLV